MELQDLSNDYELKWHVSVFRAEALALIDTDCVGHKPVDAPP
ncbi:hypothetical protein ARTHRO9AX_160016 [Arthrobacter sp. 9AX]|nr:hypothetical protein ARTHRO9AX_160016 [Arthrobacter sp. 9AX]